MNWYKLVVVVFLLIGSIRLAHAQGGPPPKVVVATPIAKKVARWDEYTGRFEAMEQVDIRPRVSGYIDKIHFNDGQAVQKGEELFTIDPRPYQIAVDSAKSDVDRARAQVTLASLEYERGEQLVTSRAVPVRELDQRRANLQSATAQAQSAEAALRNAELNLEWTVVRAPIDGRVSDRRVSVGNLVAGGQGETSLLTTIVRQDPIYFVFDGSEADYLRYQRLALAGDRPSSRDFDNPVQVRLADETTWTRAGRMNFVDNQLNARTGTIRGRATFDNKDRFLTPGTFGRLRLYGGTQDVLLVPDEAIVSDQARKIVLTVGTDNKVVPKPVTLGSIAEGLRIVVTGLNASERVVISGLANPFVRPGATVDPQPGEIKTAAQ
jgi:multidrug efflux system membrane fusion protein